jgi:phage baseplate assembly protein W
MAVLKAPFQIDPASGRVVMLTDNEQIIAQKIKDFMVTSVMERSMSPAYGANTDKLVFENFDSLFFQEYKAEALIGLRKNVSGAQILDMRLRNYGPASLATGEQNSMLIEVQYKVPPFGIKTTAISVVNPSDLSEKDPI